MMNIKGFRIIEIPLGENVAGSHYLYIKEHSGNKVNKDDAGRVLFVGNVDYRIAMTPETIDEYLRMLFDRFGDIVNVYVSTMEEGSAVTTRCAHVQFLKKSSLKLALSGNDSDYKIGCKQVCDTYGLMVRKASVMDIQKKHKFIDCNADELQQEVDSFMAEFDENELIMKKEREERLNQVDEDGFMPVKNRNKRKRTLEGGLDAAESNDFTSVTETNARRPGAPRSRKVKAKKDTELKNFYRFQIKEQKVQELDSLRKKFAEDKERVAKMKEQRKFKPF